LYKYILQGKPTGKSNSTPPARKRKISVRKEPSKKTPKRKAKDPKSRYYEQAPDSQPVVAIIPRRYRKSSSGEGEPPQDIKKSEPEKENPSKISLSAGLPAIVPKPSDNATPTSSTSNLSTAMAERRSRLMSKISRLHEQMKKKESTAPQFLPFT